MKATIRHPTRKKRPRIHPASHPPDEITPKTRTRVAPPLNERRNNRGWGQFEKSGLWGWAAGCWAGRLRRAAGSDPSLRMRPLGRTRSPRHFLAQIGRRIASKDTHGRSTFHSSAVVRAGNKDLGRKGRKWHRLPRRRSPANKAKNYPLNRGFVSRGERDETRERILARSCMILIIW